MLSNGTALETEMDVRLLARRELESVAKPIIKWAGGKRELEDTILADIDRMHPGVIRDYREPFLGGAAVFFALKRRGRIEQATLSDLNAELIGMYRSVRDDVEGVIAALQKLCRRRYSEETYYKIRAKPEAPDSNRAAARMIYLNKTCYNGLYRVNKSGLFNTPFGKRKNPKILDREALRAASAALQGVRLEVRSFMKAFYQATPSTFIYADPPYVPVSASSNFAAYQAGGFDWQEQLSLAYYMREFASYPEFRGQALLSNSHCRKTLALYQGLVRHRVAARRRINSVASKRGFVSELLVESRFRQNRK